MHVPDASAMLYHKHNAAAICRDRVLGQLGYTNDIFERNRYGFLLRGDRSAKRVKVWRAMRDHGLSYPAIAWACGMNSHAAILNACRVQQIPTIS